MENQGEKRKNGDELDEDKMESRKRCEPSESQNDATLSKPSGHTDFVASPVKSPSPPPSGMTDNDANVVDAPPLPLKRKAKPRRNSKNKIKTQPSNRWLQFLHEKRSGNASGSKLDVKKVRSEYWGLTEEEREVYDQKAFKEKLELGDNFRNKSLNVKAVDQIKEKKQKKKKPKQFAKNEDYSLGEPVLKIQKSLPALLNHLKEIDTSIDCLQLEIDELKEVKLARMVEVATSKASLKLKSENVVVLKEKVSNMYKIHRNCIIP